MLLTLVFGQKEPAGLGLNNGLLAPCPNEPNCVSSQSENPDRRVKPLAVPSNIIDPMAKLEILVRGLERTRVVESKEGYLRARFAAGLLRIRSDLEFSLDRKAGVVHVRSASRLGRWDFGANRKMVERIREIFSQDGAYRPVS